MKKIFIVLMIGFFLGAVSLFVINSKWPVNELFDHGKSSENVLVTSNSFTDVTSKLDKGGDLYLYLNTNGITKAIEKMLDNLKDTITKSSGGTPEQVKKVDDGFNLVLSVLKEAGLFEISGIGISSVEQNDGLTKTKFILHHFKGNNKGMLWNLLGSKPHSFRFLEMLSPDSVFAASSDFRPGYLWEWIKNIALRSNIPEFRKNIASLEPSLLKTGIDLKKLLASINGESGIIITLDNSDMKKIPAGGNMIEIPNPALAIIFQVKDDSIFDLVKTMVPGVKFSEENNIKKLAINAPPMPVNVEPMIIQKDGLLIIASNGNIVEGIFGAMNGKERLSGTEEFKKLSEGMPSGGNGFTFLSSRFFKTISNVQKQSVGKSPGKGKNNLDFLKKMGFSLEKLSLLRITENTEEGFVITSNSTLKTETLLMLPALTIGGIASAVAIPNLMQATTMGKQKVTMSDIRTLSVAIESYIVDSGVAPFASDMDELSKKLSPFYIKNTPLKDGWGNKFLYKHGTGEKSSFYSIASPGKDGIFEGWEQSGYYKIISKNDFNKDIILSNGEFIYYPEK